MPKPIPPEHLRLRVSGIADATDFGSSGWHSAADFRRALSGVGVHVPNVARILEWGCGCGRILAQLPVDLQKQELHGCDIDGEAIAWLQENYPAIQTVQSGGLPPLPYENGYFDLILNHSVLTHLNEAYQDAWLEELGRILSPDGVLALTVHGPFAHRRWLNTLPQGDPETLKLERRSTEALETEGTYFHKDDAWAADFPSYYQSMFHAPWYVFEHWVRYFDILSYVPWGSLVHQDMILLRHKRAE
jgi:SAM-dependent methyltransferase